MSTRRLARSGRRTLDFQPPPIKTTIVYPRCSALPLTRIFAWGAWAGSGRDVGCDVLEGAALERQRAAALGQHADKVAAAHILQRAAAGTRDLGNERWGVKGHVSRLRETSTLKQRRNMLRSRWPGQPPFPTAMRGKTIFMLPSVRPTRSSFERLLENEEARTPPALSPAVCRALASASASATRPATSHPPPPPTPAPLAVDHHDKRLPFARRVALCCAPVKNLNQLLQAALLDLLRHVVLHAVVGARLAPHAVRKEVRHVVADHLEERDAVCVLGLAETWEGRRAETFAGDRGAGASAMEPLSLPPSRRKNRR